MGFGAVLKLLVALLIVAAVQAACVPPSLASETDPDARWASSSSDFKIQLHALAAEALMLQMRPTSITMPPSGPDSGHVMRLSRAVRRDGETRLADSLRAANALLSMLEIAEYSDRGDRVRQVLLLWLESNRISLAEHLKSAGSVPSGASVDAVTAAFLEELKIIWRRLDEAYKTLETLLES